MFLTTRTNVYETCSGKHWTVSRRITGSLSTHWAERGYQLRCRHGSKPSSRIETSKILKQRKVKKERPPLTLTTMRMWVEVKEYDPVTFFFSFIFFFGLITIHRQLPLIRDRFVCHARTGLFDKGFGTKQPPPLFGRNLADFLSHTFSPIRGSKGDMQAVSLEERRDSSTSVGERAIKRLRVGEEHGGEHEVPTELCVRHPSLYLEDGNVILRCEK